MTISQRQLEENEAKIDNILHKILNACHHIGHINKSIDNIELGRSRSDISERTKRISMLTETIENLAILADKIDVDNERITFELEGKITAELDEAIAKIKEASLLLKEEKEK